MIKKKILLAGGGYADIPLIEAAKRLGFYVITSGNRKNDLGHTYSDEVQLADFSDCEAIHALAGQLKVDALCPCCNDFSALSCSYTAEKMDLPGHDLYSTSKIIHHKDQYRSFASAYGITAPLALGFDDKDKAVNDIKKIPLPVIIKPVDLTGGKGVSVINNYNHAEEAINNAFNLSKAKRIVAEEFINGSRHGFSAFIIDKKIVFHFLDNEYYYKNQYLVSAACTPGSISAEAEKKLISESEKIASLLNLKDGIFHVQFIMKGQVPVIIEICRRAPGDLYIKLVQYATGIDYPAYIVKAAAGLDCSDLKFAPVNGFYTRHCIMSDRNGVIKKIKYDNTIISNIIDEYTWWEKGDIISDFMTAKCGIVFLKFETKDEMLEKTNNMQQLIKVETE